MKKLLMLLVLLGVIAAFSGVLQAGTNPLSDIFSVNFYKDDPATLTTTIQEDQAAGMGDWLTIGWSNSQMLHNTAGGLPIETITSSNGSTATYHLVSARNGGPYDGERTNDIGDGTHDMMDGHVNATEDPYDGSFIFEIEMSDIPFGDYEVIVYMGGRANGGDLTGKFVINDGPEQTFRVMPTRFDGTFVEIINDENPGNYFTFSATGDSFNVKVWGNGFNHLGPCGIQFGVLNVMKPSPANGDTVLAANPLTLSWTNLAPVDSNDSTYVDVWFGTEPNELNPAYDMTKIVDAGVDVASATVDASAEGTYYWQVNSYLDGDPATTVYNNDDPNDPNVLEGNPWSFTVLSDTPPTVEIITPNQITWSGGPVPLVADIINEGASATIIEWVADPADDVVITDGDTATPTVTITKAPYSMAKIANAGFEDDQQVVEDGWGGAPGWAAIGRMGNWNPPEDAYDGSAVPEGIMCAWAQTRGNGLAQVLAETLAADTDYTLTVEVGNSNRYDWTGYKVQLLAGGTVIAEDDNTVSPAPGAFATSIVNYSYAPEDANKVGLPLEIRLIAGDLVPEGTYAECNFDDVQLTADPQFPILSGVVDTVKMTVFVSDAANPIPVEASVEIDVYDDACAMARIAEGKDDLNDLDKDCEVDIEDLALQAATWLNDTSIDAPAVSLDQAELPLVPNGDFETIYKPGTTIAATIQDGDYFSIGNQTMHAGAQASYADGTTGPGIELPGWTTVDGTNSDVMQAGDWGGVDGSMALLVFAGWGGPTTVETAAPLSMPVTGIGGEYKLSAMIKHAGRPVVLELLVDGAVVTPETSNIPATSEDWTEMSNTYIFIPAGDVKVLVGTRDDAGTGWTGNRASIDNVALTLESTDANMPTVDAGENMITWSDQAVTLNPTVNNNDAEPQRELSYLWTANPVDGVVFSDPVNPEDPNTSAAMAPTVTITKAAGDMASVKLTLSVTLDGQGFVNDFITIDVYDTACLAGVAANPETGFDLGDLNQDCITNLEDVAELATAWLVDYSSTGPVDQPE